MRSTGVQTQVAPSASYVVTFRVRAVESEQEEGFFHHFHRLEGYSQPRVFMRNRFLDIRREQRIRRGCEYDDILRFLMPNLFYYLK